MNNRFHLVGLATAGALLLAPVAAMAQTSAPSFSALTDNIDFSTINDAVLSTGAVAIGLTLVVLGVRKVMQMIRRA